MAIKHKSKNEKQKEKPTKVKVGFAATPLLEPPKKKNINKQKTQENKNTKVLAFLKTIVANVA